MCYNESMSKNAHVNSESLLVPNAKESVLDPLSEQKLLNRWTPGRIYSTAILGAIGGGIGQNFAENRWYLLETSIPAGPYALGALGLAALAHIALGTTDKRRARVAKQIQQEIRDTVGEPVDVFTAGRGNKQETTLRWYGADNAAADVTELIQRLRSIQDFVDKNGVDRVALSADWVRRTLGDDAGEDARFAALELYGNIEAGQPYISDKLNTAKRFDDLRSDERVLVSSSEQLETLIEQLEERADGTLIQELINRTQDSDLIRKYAEFKGAKGGAASKAHGLLLQALRQRLEGHLSADGPEAYRERTPDNVTRGRASSFLSVRGGSINRVTTRSHDPDSSVFDNSSLLGRYGARDVEELVQSVVKAERVQSGTHVEKAIAAAYLLALRRDERLYERNGSMNSKSARVLDQSETFFQRLASGHDIQRQRRPNIRRKLASVALAIGAFAVPFGATTTIEYVPEWVHAHKSSVIDSVDEEEYRQWYWGLTQEQKDAFQFGQKAREEFLSHIYHNDYPVRASLSDAAISFMQFEQDLSVSTAKVFVDLFGNVATSSIAPSLANMASAEWLAEVSKELSPGLYAEQKEQARTGDSNVNNKAVYSVESLDGTPVTGYWHAATFNQMEVGSSGIYYSNISYQFDEVSLRYYVGRSMEDLNAEASIIVSTPYLSLSDSSSKQLPILNGMAIMAVRIVDADDPSRVYTPERAKSPEDTDLVNLRLDDKEKDGIWRAGIRKPTLVYWLAPARWTPFDSYGKQFIVPGDRKKTLAEAGEGFNGISVAARKAFGLEADAPIDEVVGAISAKEYSFTPLANAGLTSLIKYDPEKSDYEMLTEAAVTLGSLDSYNCNLASTSFLLMLAAEDIGKYNYVTGFLNGADGNDSVLSTKEAHAWIMNSENEIIDPTPIGGGDASLAEPEDFPDDAASRLDARGVLAASATGVLSLVGVAALWKNRRRIRKGVQKVRTAVEEHRIRQVESHPLTPKALAVIGQALYDRKDPTEIDWTGMYPEKIGSATAHVQLDIPASERLRLLGTLNEESMGSIKEALKNTTLTRADRRAVWRVLRASGAAQNITRK